MPLSETAIKNAKPAAKQVKLVDGDGLYLLVRPNGSKWWRFDYYRPTEGRNTLSFGVYPEVPLSLARKRRGVARELVAAGVDPGSKRRAEKEAVSDSFEAVAREWFAQQEKKWAASHSSKVIDRLERDLLPWLGSRPIKDITAAELLKCLRRIEARGALDTVHRAHQNCGQILRYAIATGRAERNPAADLRGALAPAEHEHYPSITDPVQIGQLLRAIDGYQGSFPVRCALQLAPLVFVRPGELRAAQWPEFDLKKGEWRIPPERMKMGVQHLVPLSSQALAVLVNLKPLTGDGRYLFPSIRNAAKPMSENTVNVALRAMGYAKEQMTGHGFRSMASTWLNESGKWNSDAIERQLAHGEKDEVRAAYNYAKHLPERKKMMQWWADQLDELAGKRKGKAA
jgi:integrase